jgi:hypothetical protein
VDVLAISKADERAKLDGVLVSEGETERSPHALSSLPRSRRGDSL